MFLSIERSIKNYKSEAMDSVAQYATFSIPIPHHTFYTCTRHYTIYVDNYFPGVNITLMY